MRASHPNSGFSIIELYIAVLIVGFLILFGLPIVSSFIKNNPVSIELAVPSLPTQNIDTRGAIATEASNTAPAPQETPPPKTDSSSKDITEKAKNFYSVSLPILIATYSIQVAPIQANQTSWDSFINSYKNKPIDPQTNQPPRFTATTPTIGEVQYVYPASCASAFEFESYNKGYAFKTIIGTKRVCISNIANYIEK